MENPNTTWLLSDDVVNALQQNISTISAQGNVENFWLNETEDLSDNWLNGSPNGPVYTTNADGTEETLAQQNGPNGTPVNYNPVYTAYNADPGPTTWGANNNPSNPGGFDTWVDNNTMPNGDPTFVYCWSLSLVTQTESAQQNNWSTDSDSTSQSTLSFLQQFASLLNSTMTQETTIGNSEGKAMSSMIQQSSSAQNTIASIGQTYTGMLKSFASLLQSISA